MIGLCMNYLGVIHLKKKKMNGASDYDDVVDEDRIKQERKPERKPTKIFVDDVPLDVPLVPDVAVTDDDIVIGEPPPPPAKKHKTKIASHGMTTFVPPPPVSGLQQLSYDDFANMARSLDFSDVNDLLRTQQAFVDATVAAAPLLLHLTFL